MSTTRRRVVACAIAAIAVVVFLPSLRGGWIWDDHPLIADNPYVHSLSWWPRWLTSDFWNVGEQVVRFTSHILYWRPAVTASYALDWQIGGGSPVWFHVMNLVYQAAVAALAFATLRRWIGGALVPAAAAALLFALHPSKTESVAWIAGRTDILCTLAILVACTGMARRSRALEAVGTAFAYLCKEQAIVLPVFAFVEAWVAADRPALDRSTLVRCARAAAPQLALALAYLVVRMFVLPIAYVGARDTSLGIGDHVLVVLDTFGRLFEATFAPHALSAQQGVIQTVDGAMVHSLPHVVAGSLGLAALVAAAIAARRRWPAATIGIAIYLATLVPIANLKFSAMITLVSERFLYLPVLGIAFVAGAALAAADREWTRRGVALAAAVLLAFAALAAGHSADFADERAFWAREARLHSESREALMFQFRDAGRGKRYREALAKLRELQSLERRVSFEGGDVLIATEVASIEARLEPDSSRFALQKIDQFAADLLAHGKPIVELNLAPVELVVRTTVPSYLRNLGLYEPRLLVLRADLAGRLGDDKSAVELASAARAACQTCVEVVTTSALVSARAGRYDDARAILAAARGHTLESALAETSARLDRAEAANRIALTATGPQQIQARATELSELGLYGRAYDVLAPYKDEIEHAPGMVLGFAELAFRAGYPDVAREVLGDRTDIDALFAEWALHMGWEP